MTDIPDSYPLPERLSFKGTYARLEPLAPRHAIGLYRVSNDPEAQDRYAFLFEQPPHDLGDMFRWTARAGRERDRLFFAVIDRSTGQAAGRQALMRIEPHHGVCEIGSIYWGPTIARTRIATEAFYLMARYVFDELGYRRFEWKCNDRNEASKRAARRFGFAFEGVFRQHMVIKGENRDTAWFSMLDGEWPRIRAGFERWLGPGNFDDTGMQRERLNLTRNPLPAAPPELTVADLMPG